MLMHALARAPLPIRTSHRHRSPSLLRLSPPRRWNILLARANADDDAHRNDDTQRAIEGLVQRAEQLRAEQLRMEREAAALADALEGLPASQQQVVLEALGLQPKQEQQEQEEQQGDRQQTVDEQQGDWQQTSDKQQVTGSAAQLRSADEQEMSGKDVPGSDTWLAALPPYLQDQLKASGLADVLQEQADVVRQNEEWSNSEQFGGVWDPGHEAKQLHPENHTCCKPLMRMPGAEGACLSAFELQAVTWKHSPGSLRRARSCRRNQPKRCSRHGACLTCSLVMQCCRHGSCPQITTDSCSGV